MSEKIMTEQERMNFWWRKAKAAEAKLEKVEKVLREDSFVSDPGEEHFALTADKNEVFHQQGNWELAEKIREALKK